MTHLLRFWVLVPLLLLMPGCRKETDADKGVVKGQNRFTVEVDGDQREYYVHVPSTLDVGQSTPLVIMLHGSGGDGLKFYNTCGWKEVGEAENILTAFPSAWEYCVEEEGKTKKTSKWNAVGSFAFCSGERPRDDVKFLRSLIEDLGKKVNLDNRRIYIAGFSNGAAMSSKCLFEMQDVFAAICANAGFQLEGTKDDISIHVPLQVQTGSHDDNVLAANNNQPLPVNITEALNTGVMKPIIESFVKELDLGETYTTSGNVNSATFATFKGKSGLSQHVFVFSIIKAATHQYPNGDNHPFMAAKQQWAWMSQFVKP